MATATMTTDSRQRQDKRSASAPSLGISWGQGMFLLLLFLWILTTTASQVCWFILASLALTPPRAPSPAPPQQRQQARPITRLNDDNDTCRVLGPPLPIPSHSKELVAAARHSTQLFPSYTSHNRGYSQREAQCLASPALVLSYACTRNTSIYIYFWREYLNGLWCIVSLRESAIL